MKDTSVKLRRLAPLLVVAALFAAPVAAANEGTSYYVSLGDSLAVGVQPIGPPPLNETDLGYTDKINAALEAADPKLKHVGLGCSGESTTSRRTAPAWRIVSSFRTSG